MGTVYKCFSIGVFGKYSSRGNPALVSIFVSLKKSNNKSLVNVIFDYYYFFILNALYNFNL